MRKYAIFLIALIVMGGTVVSFRERLPERHSTRQTERRVSLGARIAKTADTVINTVRDSGEMQEQTFSLSEVEQLILDGTASVRIRKGDSNFLIIRSPAMLMDTMKFTQRGDRLTLNGVSVPAFIGTLQSEFELTLESIEQITMRGTGNIDILDKFSFKDLKVDSFGSGSLSIQADVQELSVSIMGSGNVNFDGSIRELSATILGSGSFRAPESQGDSVRVRVMGSGDVALGNFKEIRGSIMGSGNVSHTGNSEVRVTTPGSGRVQTRPLLAPSSRETESAEALPAP